MKEADVYIAAGIAFRRKKNGEVDGRHFQPRRGGKNTREYRRLLGQRAHRLLVERRTGIKLPATAIVHHVDPDDKRENMGLFVVCPDAAYHNLLELRGRALRACGNANWMLCYRCGKWDDPKHLIISPRQKRRRGTFGDVVHPKRHGACYVPDEPIVRDSYTCADSPSGRHNVGSKYDFRKKRTRHGLDAHCVECGQPIRRAHLKSIRWYATGTVSAPGRRPP